MKCFFWWFFAHPQNEIQSMHFICWTLYTKTVTLALVLVSASTTKLNETKTTFLQPDFYLFLVSTDGGEKIITQQATVKECRTQEPRQHAEDERWHIEWLSVDNFQINGIKFRVEIYFASFLMEKQKSTAKKMRLNSKWKQDAWEQFCGKFKKNGFRGLLKYNKQIKSKYDSKLFTCWSSQEWHFRQFEKWHFFTASFLMSDSFLAIS